MMSEKIARPNGRQLTLDLSADEREDHAYSVFSATTTSPKRHGCKDFTHPKEASLACIQAAHLEDAETNR